MKNPIAVCSWSFQKPLAGVADEMAKLKVKHVHLALQPFLEGDERHGRAEGAEALGFVQGLIDSGVWVVTSSMLSFSYEDYTTPATIRQTGGIVPDQHWEADKKLMEKAVELTRQFKTPYLSMHAGFLDESDPAAFEKFRDRVQTLADMCTKAGVQLLLESGQETADDLAKFLKSVKNVYVNLDPANIILYGKGDPIKAVATLAPWIRHVHIKDATLSAKPGIDWGNEVPWGDGEVNAKAFVEALEKIGYTGALAIEREAGDQRVADIGLAVERLRAL